MSIVGMLQRTPVHLVRLEQNNPAICKAMKNGARTITDAATGAVVAIVSATVCDPVFPLLICVGLKVQVLSGGRLEHEKVTLSGNLAFGTRVTEKLAARPAATDAFGGLT